MGKIMCFSSNKLVLSLNFQQLTLGTFRLNNFSFLCNQIFQLPWIIISIAILGESWLWATRMSSKIEIPSLMFGMILLQQSCAKHESPERCLNTSCAFSLQNTQLSNPWKNFSLWRGFWRKYALEAIIKLLFYISLFMINVYYSC